MNRLTSKSFVNQNKLFIKSQTSFKIKNLMSGQPIYMMTDDDFCIEDPIQKKENARLEYLNSINHVKIPEVIQKEQEERIKEARKQFK